MSFSLRTYFATIMALLIIVLTLLLSLGINFKTSEKFAEAIGNSLSGIAYQTADRLDDFMWSRSGEIEVLSQLEVLQDLQKPLAIQRLLEDLKYNFPSFSWVGLTEVDGKVVAATDGILVGADVSKRPVFVEAKKGQFIGDVHDAVLLAKLLRNPSGEPLQFVDISTPIEAADGTTIAVLAAHLSWEWSREVEQTILQPIHAQKRNLELFVVSNQDNTVLLGPEEMVGKPLHLSSITRARNGDNHWSLEKWPDGNYYLTATVSIVSPLVKFSRQQKSS